MFFFSKINI